MAYKKFNEWVRLKEDFTQQQTQQVTPGQTQNVTGTLQQAMKAPPPPGANPVIYKNKLMQAMQKARTTPVNSAGQAIDLVNVQNKAMQ